MQRLTTWTFFFVILALLFVAFNIQAGWLFVLDFLLIAFTAAAWILPFLWVKGNLKAERFAGRIFEGETADVLLRITNNSRFDKHFLIAEDIFPAAKEERSYPLFLPILPGKKTAELRYVAKGEKRGVFSFEPVRIRSVGPAGFFEGKRKLECGGELVVYPRPRPFPFSIENFLPAPIPSEKGIPHGKGDGEEFYGIREYEAGDSLRAVHWASSAKIGRLMIRDMMRTHPMLYTLYLDPDKRWAGEGFETCVRFAAHAAREILRQGDWLRFFDQTGGGADPKDWWGSLEFLAAIQPLENRPLSEQVTGPDLPVLIAQRQLLFFTVAPPAFSEESWDFVNLLQENVAEVRFVFFVKEKTGGTKRLEEWFRRRGVSAVFVGEDGDA